MKKVERQLLSSEMGQDEHIVRQDDTDKSRQLPLPTVSICNIAVSQLNMEDTVAYVATAIQQEQTLQIVTINPIMIMAALEDPQFMAIMQRAELIVPDGVGVVWAAKRAGEPVAERVAGIDLLHELLQKGEAHGWRVFLLGASPEVNDIAAEKLRTRFPGIDIAGHHHGFFTAEDDERIIAQIREAKPHLLFVASQLDRQEPWIDAYREQLGVPVMMGVGGSFDVIAGKVKRAPVFFQKLKLEWFYRLLSEPTRLTRMLALPKFVRHIIFTEGRAGKR